jgi:hypothetical protein
LRFIAVVDDGHVAGQTDHILTHWAFDQIGAWP